MCCIVRPTPWRRLRRCMCSCVALGLFDSLIWPCSSKFWLCSAAHGGRQGLMPLWLVPAGPLSGPSSYPLQPCTVAGPGHPHIVRMPMGGCACPTYRGGCACLYALCADARESRTPDYFWPGQAKCLHISCWVLVALTLATKAAGFAVPSLSRATCPPVRHICGCE